LFNPLFLEVEDELDVADVVNGDDALVVDIVDVLDAKGTDLTGTEVPVTFSAPPYTFFKNVPNCNVSIAEDSVFIY
jgi:hypothetical protein